MIEKTPSETLHGMLQSLYGAFFNQAMAFAFVTIAILLVYDIVAKGWEKSFSRRAVSGSLASLAIAALNILFVPFVLFAVGGLRSGYEALGIPHIPETYWAGLPVLLVALIGIITHDFADYWNHRAMHLSWLWPVHAIHHSDEEVNGFTTFRVHFMEALVMRSSYVILLSWIGIPGEAASLGAILLLMHNVYVHADLDWNHGPFKLLIASPQFHRWHHANDPRAFGRNLANLIPAYDYMFGTYIDPGVCREKMGADGVPHANVVKLMLFPFTEWVSGLQRVFAKRRSEREPEQYLDPAE